MQEESHAEPKAFFTGGEARLTQDYLRWREEVRWWRTVACAVWVFAVSVVALQCFQLSPFFFAVTEGSLLRSIFRRLALSLIFGLGVTLHCLAFRGIVHVKRTVEPVAWRWLKAVSQQPLHLFFVACNALSGLICTWAFLRVIHSSHLSSSLLNPDSCVRAAFLSGGADLGGPTAAQCLDTNYLFVLGCGLFLGVWNAIATLRQEQHLLSFPSLQRGRVFQLKSRVGGALQHSLKQAIWALPSFYLLHFLFEVLQEGSASFLDNSTAAAHLNLSLMVQLFFAATLLSLCWRLSCNVVEIILTQWLCFDPLRSALATNAPPGKSEHRLGQGLLDQTDPLMRHLAFLDLSMLASHSTRRRANIFEDDTARTWQAIMHICCSHIDAFSLEVMQVIQTVKALREEENIAKRKGEVASSVISRSKAGPGLFKSLRQRLFQLNDQQRTQQLFAEYNLLLWSIKALSQMVCKSRAEDRYGVVQTSEGVLISLQSLVACLLAVEEYVEQPCDVPFSSSSPLEGHRLVRPQPHAVITATQDAIYGIVTAFYEHLASLKLPPRYSQKLQHFVEFEE
ncbi:Nuclear pore complex subunit [Balamuthia mandrillaris]